MTRKGKVTVACEVGLGNGLELLGHLTYIQLNGLLRSIAMPEYCADPEVLVSTDWLAEHLNDPNVVVAEVNTDLQTNYHRGHVPEAVGWSLHSDLEDQIRRDIPSGSQLEELLSRSGIDNDTLVVLYGDGNNRSATWAFWVLKFYRHKMVRLLNGGRKKWIDDGRHLSLETPNSTFKRYEVGVPNLNLRATREYILANLQNPSLRLLDTRTYEEYTGFLSSASGTQHADIYRQGRIPGAVHVPWDDGVAEDGTFKDIDELREMYRQRGFNPAQEIVPYCRLGVRASYSWFVLKYLLGYERVRNYDGSWTEWGNSIGMPIDIGPVTDSDQP